VEHLELLVVPTQVMVVVVVRVKAVTTVVLVDQVL
jgi:hypothetical protein